jgi:CubicO group peptidase (beta-lactamase class C family)
MAANVLKLLPTFALSCVLLQAQDLTSHLDTLLAKYNDKNGPGMAAMLIRDGRVVYRKDFGYADLDAHTLIARDTQFLLGSMTKQFTAMAIMILKERGKLQFEDPLSKFCPEFPAYARAIAIRHLLNHTSGMPDYEEILLGGKVDYDKLFQSSKSTRTAHEYTSAEALSALSRQQKLRFAPGEKFEYSNSGYVVLGQIIERLSGMRYAEFLKQNIFDPLEMHDTLVVDERHQKMRRLARGYGKRIGTWQDIGYTPEDYVYGEDGIHGTIDDLYKWDQALYTEKLVHRATLAMAFSPGHTNDGKNTDTYMTGILKRPTSYGFGWFITPENGTLEVEHGGFWSGYRSYILRIPPRRLTAIVLMNSADDQVGLIAHQIIDAAGR